MSDSRLTSSVAQFVAVFVECIFYGIYLVTFGAYLKHVLWPSPHHGSASRFKTYWLMLIVVFLLFIFSTLNLALGFFRIFQAFVDGQPAGSSAPKQSGQGWINILKPVCVNAQALVADCVLIYRCWIIYSNSLRVIVPPILLWLGGIACTAVSMYKRASQNTSLPVMISFSASTICINLYTTSMIVYRIWSVVRESAGSDDPPPLFQFAARRNRLETVMQIVIESALMNTVTSIIGFATLLSKSNSFFITSGIGIQVVGITFNLILIRAMLNAGEATIVRGNLGSTKTISFARAAETDLHQATGRSPSIDNEITGSRVSVSARDTEQGRAGYPAL